MKYLVFDTSGSNIELLFCSDKKTSYFHDENFTKASEVLLIKADEILRENRVSLEDLDFLGVVTGPGSFTGIRIGLTTVKTMAYALGKRILAATSLEKLAAYNTTDKEVYALVDGSNGTAYLQKFDSGGNALSEARCIFVRDLEKHVDEKSLIISDKIQVSGIDIIEYKFQQNSLKSVFDRRIGQKAWLSYSEVEAVYLRRAQAERKEGEL